MVGGAPGVGENIKRAARARQSDRVELLGAAARLQLPPEPQRCALLVDPLDELRGCERPLVAAADEGRGRGESRKMSDPRFLSHAAVRLAYSG